MKQIIISYIKLKPRSVFVIIFLFAGFLCHAKTVINDVTQINPILVESVLTPTTKEQVQDAVRNYKGKISIGGGRYSMGGQTATENALQIDMRKMNKVVNLDIVNKKITVEAGIRWRDIQDAIDPHNLSVKIMQTYSNFTVGGSLSVNVHGRYIGQGPLIRSVDSLKIVLADGSLITVTPSENKEVFYGAIGGYGAMGVIVEATLQLVDNIKVERQAKLVPAADYKKFFFSEIRDNAKVVFHNGDIYPPDFTKVSAVTWSETDKELTVKKRLIPRNQKYKFQTTAISALTNMPMGNKIRSELLDPLLYAKPKVTWRNHEASYDVAELEPASRAKTTFVLQEYFIPVDKFDEFVPKMRGVFDKYHVNVFNVSIRHALPDLGSLMAWARTEVFAFVVYYKQDVTPSARQTVGKWTREMIAEILSVGGTYYLPYQIHATDDQFQRAYPNYQAFFDLKQKLDPDYKFRNKLWDRYYLSMPHEIAAATAELKDYTRREDQSFLALPEWYIVFNGDEYANFLKNKRPSEFPYLLSAAEFWSLKSKVKVLTQDKYPSNMGYNVMLWVIGTSYSVELVVKGVYESTIGKLTEFLSNSSGTDEDKLIGRFHKEYADFVHIYPWYEFSFFDRLKIFWKDSSFFGNNFIRKLERKVYFSIEYLVKSVYATVITLGTKASYEPEASIIHAVVNDPSHKLWQFADVKILKSFDSFKLVTIPRYDRFRELAKEMAKAQIKFVEIAGNRKIFLTLIIDRSQRPQIDAGEIVGTSAVVTDSSKERLLVSCGVSSLGDLLASGVTVEHIFDY